MGENKQIITLVDDCCVDGEKRKSGEVLHVDNKTANILLGLNRAVKGEVKKEEPKKVEDAPKKKVATKKVTKKVAEKDEE